MEALIIDKHEKRVRVDTTIGCFEGTWCSADPADFRRYILELDSDEILTLEAIKLSNIDTSYIKYIDDKIYVYSRGVVDEKSFICIVVILWND